jgi:hypothetical protein
MRSTRVRTAWGRALSQLILDFVAVMELRSISRQPAASPSMRRVARAIHGLEVLERYIILDETMAPTAVAALTSRLVIALVVRAKLAA